MKILIGGQALKNLGSSRYTKDIDYLILDDSNLFTRDKANNINYINANKSEFYKKITKLATIEVDGVTQASPQALIEMKAYTFVQLNHNGYWDKLDDCEYDIKFLNEKFGVTPCIAYDFLESEAIKKIEKLLK